MTSFGFVLAVGYLDEILQGIHPERVFDYRDIALNTYGGLLGLLILWPCVAELRFYKRVTTE
jgi:glycopeptide antibiotics resistance protein